MLQEDSKKIEFCPLEKCRIKTRKDVKVIKKGCNFPQALEIKAQKHIDSLLESGVIRCSNSTWRNPVSFLEKPNGGIRLVEKMIMLNKFVEKDPYTLPNMKELIRAAYGSEIFSVVDLMDSFYAIEIVEEDKHKTAFDVKGRIYEWNGMTMGFVKTPQIMQRVMDKIFNDLKNKGVEIYLDDIIKTCKNEKTAR